jgi:urease accessory protein
MTPHEPPTGRWHALKVLNEVVGHTTDSGIAKKLRELEGKGQVEYVAITRDDSRRHRLRIRSDRDTEWAIALPRTAHLQDGSVLLLDDDRAVVVRLRERGWMSLAPRDVASALELGYLAGNNHWKVRFDGVILSVALEGPEQTYLDRLTSHLADSRVTRVPNA